MYRKCCVPSCLSKQGDVQMYKVPRSLNRQKLWLRIIGDTKLYKLKESQCSSLKVCEKHFENRFKNRLRLRCCAFPSLFTEEEINKGTPLKSRCNIGNTFHKPSSKDKHQDHNYVKNIKFIEREVTADVSNADDVIMPDEVAMLRDDDDNVDTLAHINDDGAVYSSDHIAEEHLFSWQQNADLVPTVKDEQDIDIDLALGTEVGYEDPNDISMYTFKGTTSDQNSKNTGNPEHLTHQCHNCGGLINGFRYVCTQCVDYELCSVCEAAAAHCHHYALRVPVDRPQNEVQIVLHVIRQQFMENISLTCLLGDGLIEQVKVEATEEPDDVRDVDDPLRTDTPLATTEPVFCSSDNDIETTDSKRKNETKVILSNDEIQRKCNVPILRKIPNTDVQLCKRINQYKKNGKQIKLLENVKRVSQEENEQKFNKNLDMKKDILDMRQGSNLIKIDNSTINSKIGIGEVVARSTKPPKRLTPLTPKQVKLLKLNKLKINMT